MGIKQKTSVINLAVCFHLSLFSALSHSFTTTPNLNLPKRLTTHTADDFQPTVSPDGKMISFVSNRSGNNDIWLAPVSGGPARQLTAHTASDTAPAWSRDGRKIAFTSQREDSKGDIWILDLEGGGETRVTDQRSAESNPSWFPDGKKIVFSRGDEVWSIDLLTKKEVRLFQGHYPTVSPDGRFIAYISFGQESFKGAIWVYRIADKKAFRMTSGEFSDAFPSWSPDGKEIFFSRFSEDADNDGRIDVNDNPSIWKIDFSSEVGNQKLKTKNLKPIFQLTSGSSYEIFPFATDNNLIFAASKGKDLDIYSISIDGEVPGLETTRAQLELAYKVKEPWRAILAFRKLYMTALGFGSWESGDEALFAEARYQAALKYLGMGHKSDAVRELESLISSFPKERKYASLARIELSKMRAADYVAAGDKGGASGEIKKLRDIIDEYKDQPYSRGMAELEIGNIYLSLKDDVRALKEYEKVREQYPEEAEPAAQARLRMADIYTSYGDETRVIETYVSIIKDYPNSQEWCLTASQRVLSLVERIDNERERLSRYRDIASRYRGLLYLPALAQYRIAESYHVKGEYGDALQEYRNLIEGFPSEDLMVNEASIAMAEAESSRGAYNNAIAIYQGLMKRGDPRAKGLYIKTFLEKGRSELLGKEPAQAIKSFRAIIDIDYDNVRAHRGIIEAYAMKGEAAKALSIYSDDVRRLPESDTSHYALGLAYTYLEDSLLAAESEIKKALSINYSLPFAHQTLGWIYEVRDKLGGGKTMAMAVDEYQAALALLGHEDRKEEADLLLNLGNGYSALGNHEKGYEYYKRRLETGIGFADPKREALFYESLGNEASRVGRYREAVPFYMNALRYAQKAGERGWEMKVSEEMALLYQEAGEYAKAADYFSGALKIAEEERMEEKKALLLRNIAYNLYHAGKVEEAVSYFNRSLDALKVKEEAVEAAGILTIKKALALGREGSEAFMGFEKTGEEKLIYSYLGRAYAEIGEYESALAGLLRKLELIPREGRDTERGIVLNNIGFLYYQMGDAENAYHYFNDSMMVSKKAGNLTGEIVNIVNMGLLEAQMKSGVRSEESEAIRLQERGIGLIESEKRGMEYLPYLKNNLGLLYLTRGLSLFTDEVKRSRRIGTVPGPATDLNSIIKTSLNTIEQGRDSLKKAVGYFKDGLNLFPEGKDPWLEAVLELNLATAFYHLGNDMESSDHLASAMKLIEANSINGLKWRGLWLLAELDGENRLRHLEDAVAALPPLHPPLIKGVESGLPSIIETESLYKELISLLFSSGRLDDAFAYAERMAIKRTWNEAAKARYPLPKTEEPLSARDVQWFLDEKTAVIRYLITDTGLLVWVIDSDNIQGKTVKASGEELEEGIADFLSSLDKAKGDCPRFTDTPFCEERLSPLIIEPVAGLLTGKKRLLIIPDDDLSIVPFAALSIISSPLAGEDKGGGAVHREFLAERFEIAYLPSSAVFNAAYERRNLNKVNILISQEEGYSDGYVEGIGSKTPIFATLKGDKTRFLDMASNYGIIHITDSLSINQAAPFRSAIYFGKEKLTLSELMKLKMNPSLVVLSNIKPTLTSSLSYSLQPFILSGAPSILIKTIPVDRESEEIFMKEFYDAFRKESAAGALAKAQRKLISQGMSPKIWAGYALYGYPGMNEEEERKYASQRVADIMNSAIEAYSKGDWKGSIKMFEEGLLFLKTIGAKENLGSIYQALVKASANSGEYAKGALYQEEFIKTGSGKLSKAELAEGYKTLAVLHSKGGKDDKAEAAIKEAIRLWQGLDERKRLSEGYRTLALLQEKGGDYEQSLSSFKAALDIDRGLKDDAAAGQDLWDIGRIYYLRLSRLDDALKAYNEALSIFMGMGRKDRIAAVILDIGLVHEQEGEYEKAKVRYIEGVRISGEVGDKALYSRGNLYLANVAWHTGDYQQVFRYLDIALSSAVELKDRKLEAMAHNLAGLTYMNLGMLEKALDSLSKSLAISMETGDRLDAAAAYNNIGIVYRELGNLEKSVESFKKALSIDTELKSKWGMAYDMRNLGISYERIGRLDDALESLNLSLSLSREIGERKNEAMALYSIGMLYMRKGRGDDAHRTLEDAYVRGKELNLPEVVWRSLKARAGILADRKEMDGAYDALKEAIEVVERMRGRIKVDEYKTGFLENKADLYEDMVLLLLGMGRVDDAFNYSERGRSRNFIDILGNQRISLNSSASQRLLDRERNLSRRIESLEERIRGEKEKKTLLEELGKARKDYEALLLNIKEESPELAAFVTVEPPSLQDIRKAIPRDTVFLEYMVAKDGVVIWTVSSERTESTFVSISKGSLREKVVRYRELMERVAPLERESLELYDLLIRPVENHLNGIKYLGIIPHDLLHYLSFSSLFDGKRYLMESHPLFYAPSAGVLKMIVDRQIREYEERDTGKGSASSLVARHPSRFLIIGNPDLGDPAYDLPFAEREALSIVREYEGSELLTRKEATETRARDEIERFNGIHFASHGVYDPATPLLSTLKLARDDANDGNLTANEVFSINIKASLVMMSACQTGLGKLTTGDEIIGLSRAFIYAGAPSIISTLWRVNDAASAMLVKRFYRNYKENDLAESLRLAQAAVKGYYPHPAYWAGFGLTGYYR